LLFTVCLVLLSTVINYPTIVVVCISNVPRAAAEAAAPALVPVRIAGAGAGDALTTAAGISPRICSPCCPFRNRISGMCGLENGKTSFFGKKYRYLIFGAVLRIRIRCFFTPQTKFVNSLYTKRGGIRCFFTPRIRDGAMVGSGSGKKHPGSATLRLDFTIFCLDGY
jgi:hypothetical protein